MHVYIRWAALVCRCGTDWKRSQDTGGRRITCCSDYHWHAGWRVQGAPWRTKCRSWSTMTNYHLPLTCCWRLPPITTSSFGGGGGGSGMLKVGWKKRAKLCADLSRLSTPTWGSGCLTQLSSYLRKAGPERVFQLIKYLSHSTLYQDAQRGGKKHFLKVTLG